MEVNKLSINLLPVEFTQTQFERSKFYKVQTFGVALVILITFLASLVVALRIIQSQNVNIVQNKLAKAQEKVSELKVKESNLVLLKDRVLAATQILGTPSKQLFIYNLVNNLAPPSLSINSMAVDGSANVTISAVTTDSASLDKFFSELLDKDKNQGKVSQLVIDSMSRSRDGIYRVNFKIIAK